MLSQRRLCFKASVVSVPSVIQVVPRATIPASFDKCSAF